MARYTEEFRREAVALYRSGDAGIAKTAKSLGVAPESLRAWVRKYESDEKNLDITERERLRQAEREVARLREENDILKKAAAFFAKESTKS